MDQDHLEATLLWSDSGPSPAAEQWLRDQGFQVLEMRAGLLFTGPRESFEAAFGFDLSDMELPVSLPRRGVLNEVADVAIRRPPEYRAGT